MFRKRFYLLSHSKETYKTLNLETSKLTFFSAFKANDEVALRIFYKENYCKTKNYVLNNSGTIEHAKDIYQEAFIAVWRNIQLDKFYPENGNSLEGYAGSKSILTGLWKIDEQASALLLDIFYRNLLKGMDKDEALRQAKLSYLQNAEGRMLAPQYWAGLVIMGDTSPITLAQNNDNPRILIFVILILLLGSGYFFIKRNNRPGMKKTTYP